MIMYASRAARWRTLHPAHVAFGIALTLSAALTALRWHQDWNGSEGTYALTARALLNGGDLYGDVVVAHPPGLFVVGAGVLALDDSLDLLRAAMVALQLGALMLLATATVRMTGARWAGATVPVVGVLLPWTVHEQGVYQPEAVALPFLAGALVLAPRPRGSAWAGALLALAVGVKLPMLIPALLGVWTAADRRRAAIGFAAALGASAGASSAVFGTGLVDDVVLAQLEVGRHGVRDIAGLGVQATWNLLPLLLGVLAVGVARRRGWRPADPRQWRVAVALAVGTTLTFASTLKVGTTLTVMPPVEALLLPLAVAGAVVWLDDGGVFRGTPMLRRAVVGVLMALLLVQSLSLVAQPHTGRALFVRPLSAPAWSVQMMGDEVDARVAALRHCARGLASGETPTVTFRADRRMPGDQPDVFLPSRSRRLADVQARVVADRPRCPTGFTALLHEPR
jgi:hypothetical protein